MRAIKLIGELWSLMDADENPEVFITLAAEPGDVTIPVNSVLYKDGKLYVSQLKVE